MKRSFIIVSTIFLLFSISYTYGNDLPGIRIKNPCEEKYPESSRNSYNHPQYKVAYSRCVDAYNTYSGALDTAMQQWSKASSQNGKSEDWINAEISINAAYNIISENGENLVGWFDRDRLMGYIYEYVKAIKGHTPLNIKKEITTNSNTGGTISISSGVVIQEKMKENVCKTGFIFNPKNGRCKKVLKVKTN